MYKLSNQTIQIIKLAAAGLILCLPALICIVIAFFLQDMPWYLLLLCLLLTSGGVFLVISLSKKIIFIPLRRVRSSLESLLGETLGEDIPQNGDDFKVILGGLESIRGFLREAKQEQELYEENRKDIIAGISHDIGTPLASIMGCAEVLLEGILTTPEQHQTYLKTIHSKSIELNQLATDFFMFSCLDMDNLPFHFEDFEYDDVFTPILMDISDSFRKNNIYFEVIKRGFPPPEPFVLHVDPLQLKRIFQNLTNNCIKYMQRGDSNNPEARFSADYLPDKRLRLTLESNGLPVSHEDCGRIFTPYFRTNGAKSSAVNGSGIGLTVCKQLIDMHKGTICARQSILGGLAVEVTFPVKDPIML